MSNTEALRTALQQISLCSQNSASSKEECGRIARAALAQPAASGEPVHQWRKAYCADWYDGHPDNDDGGGPYETRTLYAAQPAPALVPPEDWSVFNDSACVADGLSYAEALDYLTPERLQRGWSAVCVANRDNIVDDTPAKEAPL